MIRIINKNNYVPQLKFKTSLSAGFDIPSNESVTLQPGEYRVVKTGLFLEPSTAQFSVVHDNLPHLEIRSRSGLAAKFGVAVLNSPGTVDLDYPGEIGVILINHGSKEFTVNPGDNIAQGLVVRVDQGIIGVEVAEVVREGGFGSTGK